VRPKGHDGIEFDFYHEGKRYRITLPRLPNEAKLRRAEQQLADIKRRMKWDPSFKLEEEFPEYRFKKNLPETQKKTTPPKESETPQPAQRGRTCNELFDAFLDHCETRVACGDMAFSTLNGYRKILKRAWRPKLGKREFIGVVYSELLTIATAQGWKSKKTYNNGVGPLRCAFEFGFKDHPELTNPAAGLDCFRIMKKDRPPVDPFTIQEAETLILGIHAEWGEAMGNFDEFRFFTGLRQSEQIALRVRECDLQQGTITVRHVIVLGRDKDRTKTSEDRTVELCPRALAVLRRQLALREQQVRAGKVKHDFVFFKDDGAPIRSLKYPYMRWRYVIDQLGIRYRDPYNARHSCVSWHLMIGKNPLWCSRQHGHSVQVMYSRYGVWIEGANQADIEIIKTSMAAEPSGARVERLQLPSYPLPSPDLVTTRSLHEGWGRLSWRKVKHFNGLTGGADGTRTRDPRRDRPVF